MDDQAIENEIQAKGKTAPRITPADLAANIHHIETVKHVTQSGQVLRWAVLVTQSGFGVVGKPSVAVSPENDNVEIGEQIAFDNSRDELWPLMGFALKERLNFQAKLRDLIVVQSHPDTLSAGEYMRGLDNGMILALAVSENKDPQYIEAPQRPPVAASTLPPHQQRVVAEHAELCDKTDKLQAFFKNPLYDALPTGEQMRLANQVIAMQTYGDILAERIAAF